MVQSRRAEHAKPAAEGRAVQDTGPRVLKKYPNRRLYDTHASSYITLADVKVGDVADLTYSKNPDGLVARSIHIR